MPAVIRSHGRLDYDGVAAALAGDLRGAHARYKEHLPQLELLARVAGRLRARRLARGALDLFLECFGAVAGDHALAVLARGGVWLAGGIAPKILPQLRSGPFLAAFNAKGAHAGLAARFPVRVVLSERIGLLGAARIAAAV